MRTRTRETDVASLRPFISNFVVTASGSLRLADKTRLASRASKRDRGHQRFLRGPSRHPSLVLGSLVIVFSWRILQAQSLSSPPRHAIYTNKLKYIGLVQQAVGLAARQRLSANCAASTAPRPLDA